MNMAQAQKKIKDMEARIDALEYIDTDLIKMIAYSNLVLAEAAIQDRSGWSPDSHQLKEMRLSLETETL